MPDRVLDDYELVWMLRGRARLTGDAPLDLEAGDVLLIPPGLGHGIAWLGGQGRMPTRHGFVHFASEERFAPSPLRVHGTRDDPLSGLGAYLLWLAALPGPAEASVRRTVDFMIDVVLDRSTPHPAVQTMVPDPVSRALGWWRHVWTHPPLRPVPTESMARAAHVSTAHLNRLFGRTFGCGPATAVSRLRCVRAEDLIRDTDLPLASVAWECGYADAAHLSHRFRALHGISPRDYRARGLTASVLDDPGIRLISHLVWHD